MCFVVYEECVLAKEPGVQRAALKSAAIPREQQSAANHVHRASDHRRAGRICTPLPVVGMLAAERTDGERANVLGQGI